MFQEFVGKWKFDTVRKFEWQLTTGIFVLNKNAAKDVPSTRFVLNHCFLRGCPIEAVITLSIVEG